MKPVVQCIDTSCHTPQRSSSRHGSSAMDFLPAAGFGYSNLDFKALLSCFDLLQVLCCTVCGSF
jgi:hypothetical protein